MRQLGVRAWSVFLLFFFLRHFIGGKLVGSLLTGYFGCIFGWLNALVFSGIFFCGVLKEKIKQVFLFCLLDFFFFFCSG
jgi:hypothetical protein